VDTILVAQNSDQWSALALMIVTNTDDSSRAGNFLSS